jgi:hypothetical protein
MERAADRLRWIRLNFAKAAKRHRPGRFLWGIINGIDRALLRGGLLVVDALLLVGRGVYR